MTDTNADSMGLRIMALLWHSPHRAVTAGGFKRTHEILKRIPEGVTVNAIDNAPSFLSDIVSERLTVQEYRVPETIRRLERRFYRIERLFERLISFYFLCAMTLRLNRGNGFDVILVPYSEVVAMLAAGVFARWVSGKRLVLVNHNIEHFSLPLRIVVVWLHNRSDQVIAVSQDLRDRLKASGVRVPIAVNSNGLDATCAGAAAARQNGAKRYDAVFVGRHVPAKGVDDLLQAWSMVTVRLPGAKLITIGSCDPATREKLDEQIESLGIAQAVQIKGIVDEDEKYDLVAQSKLLLFPSRLEGWGLVPQEALACGLPVVVYDLPVYAENIRGCEAVFTVPVGDIKGLAREAVALLEQDAWREHSETGPQFVRRFDWDEIAKMEFELISGGSKGDGGRQ